MLCGSGKKSLSCYIRRELKIDSSIEIQVLNEWHRKINFLSLSEKAKPEDFAVDERR